MSFIQSCLNCNIVHLLLMSIPALYGWKFSHASSNPHLYPMDFSMFANSKGKSSGLVVPPLNRKGKLGYPKNKRTITKRNFNNNNTNSRRQTRSLISKRSNPNLHDSYNFYPSSLGSPGRLNQARKSYLDMDRMAVQASYGGDLGRIGRGNRNDIFGMFG